MSARLLSQHDAPTRVVRVTSLHIIPTRDAMPHELAEDCPCGPEVSCVPAGFQHSHHQLEPRLKTKWIVCEESAQLDWEIRKEDV